jgi:hypothetical protein
MRAPRVLGVQYYCAYLEPTNPGLGPMVELTVGLLNLAEGGFRILQDATSEA